MRKLITAVAATAMLVGGGFGVAGAKTPTKFERFMDVNSQDGIAFGQLASKSPKCVAGQKIVLRRMFPNEATVKVAVTKSDSQGSFGVQGLDPGIYFFKAPKTKLGSKTCLPVTSNKTEVS